MFASRAVLGVRAPVQEVDYRAIASPSGPLGCTSWRRQARASAEDKWFQTGSPAALVSPSAVVAPPSAHEYKGVENGCEQVCFVDAATKTTPEELGGMNMMAVQPRWPRGRRPRP